MLFSDDFVGVENTFYGHDDFASGRVIMSCQRRGIVDGEMGKKRRNARHAKKDAALERTVAAGRHIVVSDIWLHSQKSDSPCIK
ncbi:hypothetical protein ACLOJK_028062 [Asimina triloba]